VVGLLILLVAVLGGALIRDQAEGEHLHVTMPGSDDLVDGGHAHRIHAHHTQSLQLGDGLVVGTTEAGVDAHMDVRLDAHGLADLDGLVDQILVVRVDKGGEPGSETRVIGSLERGVAGETQHVDMVVHQHDVTHREARIDATRRIRGEQVLYAAQLHHAYRHRALGQRVALVEVEPSLHRHHGGALEGADHQSSGMALHCGHREVGDLLVLEDLRVLDDISQRAESRATNDPDLGAHAGALGNEVGDLLDDLIGIPKEIRNRN